MSDKTILITGTYTATDAYPNVKNRIELIHNFSEFKVNEFNYPAKIKIKYTTIFQRLYSLFLVFFRLLISAIFVVKTIYVHRNYRTLYIPYPSIHILFILSFLPKKWAPKNIVADIFISIYDTVVIDRKLISKNSAIAKLLRIVERRSMRRASALITDTRENSIFLQNLLDLSECLFHDIPLSINNNIFQKNLTTKIEKKDKDVFEILFVGTLVPLHNVGLLCEAISQIQANEKIKITIIGDGQDSPIVKRMIDTRSNDSKGIEIIWIAKWQESSSIAKYIKSADICVGILGDQGKSQRVWPFKNYLYMACGKALVTAESPVTTRMLSERTDQPFLTVKTNNANSLVQKLELLASDKNLLNSIEIDSLNFYEETLSQKAISKKLKKLLC